MSIQRTLNKCDPNNEFLHYNYKTNCWMLRSYLVACLDIEVNEDFDLQLLEFVTLSIYWALLILQALCSTDDAKVYVWGQTNSYQNSCSIYYLC